MKMKNVFFPEISPEKKGKLTEAEVAFVDFSIDDVDGIVIDEDFIAKAMEILGAVIETETATSYEGIVKVSLSFQQRETVVGEESLAPFTVKVESWNGRRESDFVEVAREVLLPALQKNVKIFVPHRHRVYPPDEDGEFNIFFWSTTSENDVNFGDVPRKIWDVVVDVRDDPFIPDPSHGTIIYDGDYAVGQIVGNNLFIHHDLCHEGTSQELTIFRRLLEEVVVELTATPEEKAERARKEAEERLIRSREAYVSECSARFEKTVRGTKKKISSGTEEIKRLQQSLVKKIREVKGAERKLEQLSASKGGELEKYGEEFDKLFSVRGVRDVLVADGVIKVFTDILYCADPRSGKRHEIGAFRIEIYTSGANDGVRWFNLTRRVDAYENGMQAPHVFPSGKACLGNTEEVFPELIANYEFAVAAMVAIQFVKSVNTDDSAGRYIDNWPVAEEAPAAEVENV